MRNTKTILNLFVVTGFGLTFSLLTACGGGGDSKSTADPVVTTIPNCTTSSIYKAPTGTATTGTWIYSATDSRECKAITTVAESVTCPSNQVKVRIPITSSSTTVSNENTCINYGGQILCGSSTNNNYNVNNSTNYHSTANSYKEVCMNQSSQDWHYVVSAGNYYYLNYNLAYNDFKTDQYQYQYHYQRQLSPTETILTFGLVTAALLFLAH